MGSSLHLTHKLCLRKWGNGARSVPKCAEDVPSIRGWGNPGKRAKMAIDEMVGVRQGGSEQKRAGDRSIIEAKRFVPAKRLEQCRMTLTYLAFLRLFFSFSNRACGRLSREVGLRYAGID
jgi:hypothetical protein